MYGINDAELQDIDLQPNTYYPGISVNDENVNFLAGIPLRNHNAPVAPQQLFNSAFNKNEIINLETAIDLGADANKTNSQGSSPLQIAIANQNEPIIMLLLSKGVDVNYQNPLGRTALHYAAGKGYDRIVKALLAHGADYQATDFNGNTPEAYALNNENTEVALTLITFRSQMEARAAQMSNGTNRTFLLRTLEENAYPVPGQTETVTSYSFKY